MAMVAPFCAKSTRADSQLTCFLIGILALSVKSADLLLSLCVCLSVRMSVRHTIYLESVGWIITILHQWSQDMNSSKRSINAAVTPRRLGRRIASVHGILINASNTSTKRPQRVCKNVERRQRLDKCLRRK